MAFSVTKTLPKLLTFVVLSLPAAWLALAVVGEANSPGSQLGADPVAAVVDFLGEWGLRVLLLTLLVSPLRRISGWSWLARVRRMVGLFAFAYLSLHFLAFVGLIVGWDLSALLVEIVERPYITVGFLALLLLLPLAVTSTQGWQKRLRRRWVQLHKLVFAAVGLGLLHLVWLTKDGYAEISLYLLIFVLALGERWWHARPALAAQSKIA